MEKTKLNIPYYRFIEDECYLLPSKDNIPELAVKLLSDNITDDEYKEFIQQCLLKTKLKRK
jgi:hypothetical protein